MWQVPIPVLPLACRYPQLHSGFASRAIRRTALFATPSWSGLPRRLRRMGQALSWIAPAGPRPLLSNKECRSLIYNTPVPGYRPARDLAGFSESPQVTKCHKVPSRLYRPSGSV